MTRKHMVAAAEVIKKFSADGWDKYEIACVKRAFSDFFTRFNPMFDYDRFSKACEPDPVHADRAALFMPSNRCGDR